MNTHTLNAALLGALGLTLACASDDAPSVINSAGSGGAAEPGNVGGSGGSAGSGGNGAGGDAGNAGTPSSGGDSGSAGAGGSAPQDAAPRDCTASTTALAPADGFIANFAGSDAGVDAGVASGVFAFPSGSAAAPSFDTTNGTLHITANSPATAEPQIPIVLLGWDGCVDASAFSGVSFSISGSFSGCTMQYGTADVAHQDRNSGAPYATGPAGSYSPQTTITAAQLTEAPQTLLMPFVGGPSGGSPPTPVDEAKLIFLLWQFSIPPNGSAPCVADISIDDVTFY